MRMCTCRGACTFLCAQKCARVCGVCRYVYAMCVGVGVGVCVRVCVRILRFRSASAALYEMVSSTFSHLVSTAIIPFWGSLYGPYG